MLILAQESRTTIIKFGGEEIDLSTFTQIELRTLLIDMSAVMKANNAMRKAGKRDVITTIRVESIYVGITHQVQKVLALQLATPDQNVAPAGEPISSLLVPHAA